MKVNSQKLRARVKTGCRELISTSRELLSRIGPFPLQDTNDLSNFDESILAGSFLDSDSHLDTSWQQHVRSGLAGFGAH